MDEPQSLPIEQASYPVPEECTIPEDSYSLLLLRNEYRRNKQYEWADLVKDTLLSQGYYISDFADGTSTMSRKTEKTIMVEDRNQITTNKNSIRRRTQSKVNARKRQVKSRGREFADWVLATFAEEFICKDGKPVVIDVAGGRGDVSFHLRSRFHDCRCIIIDPSMLKLSRSKTKTAIRIGSSAASTDADSRNLPTSDYTVSSCDSAEVKRADICVDRDELALHVDAAVSRAYVTNVLDYIHSEAALSLAADMNDERILWFNFDTLLEEAAYLMSTKIDGNEDMRDDLALRIVATSALKGMSSLQICHQRMYFSYPSRATLTAVNGASLIIGFHADQATEACIDVGISNRIPFAVVPCCVFPSAFPNRFLNGQQVRSYKHFLQYLRNKDPRIREEIIHNLLPPNNVVLYMRKSDFTTIE